MRESAIALYDQWLRGDAGLGAELFARLKGAMAARGLVYGGREIGVSLRPHMLTRAQYDRLTHDSEVLAGAFERVVSVLLSDERLLARVGLTDAERRLALVHPGFEPATVTTRLDAFIRDDELKFVEYNAENPSSLTDQSGLNEVLFEVTAMQRLSERYRLRQYDPPARLFEALTETYREWAGRAETPNVAIVDWPDLPTATEFALLRNYFVGRGMPTIICSPEELEYEGGSLRRGDFQIDLVYKRVIIHELLSRYDETHPLVRAYVNRDVCLVNPFRCKVAHKKAAFELLTDGGGEGWLTPREREVVRRTVPWTRRVEERRTRRGGREVDLVEHVRRRREEFVLKPNDDYGGHGVTLGREATESEWDDALAAALAADYVVQEAIELPVEDFPIFDRERWGFQPMYVDTNPFLFRGRVEGAMVRLSASPVVNVTSGGGETGLFVIEGEA